MVMETPRVVDAYRTDEVDELGILHKLGQLGNPAGDGGRPQHVLNLAIATQVLVDVFNGLLEPASPDCHHVATTHTYARLESYLNERSESLSDTITSNLNGRYLCHVVRL